MGNYTTIMSENPRRGRQARNFAKKCSENWVPLQIDYIKNCNLRSRGLVRNLHNLSPAKQIPGHE